MRVVHLRHRRKLGYFAQVEGAVANLGWDRVNTTGTESKTAFLYDVWLVDAIQHSGQEHAVLVICDSAAVVALADGIFEGREGDYRLLGGITSCIWACGLERAVTDVHVELASRDAEVPVIKAIWNVPPAAPFSVLLHSSDMITLSNIVC